MAKFVYRKSLNGEDNPQIYDAIIANSSTVAIGEAVKLQAQGSGGGIIRATAGSKILGIVVGLIDSMGIDLDNTKQSLDGTWTTATQTYVSASNNMTVKQVKAKIMIDQSALFHNVTATAVLAVADIFKYFDVTSATQIANQTGNDTAGAFQLMQIDPDGDGDTTKGLFRIAESYLQPYAQQ